MDPIFRKILANRDNQGRLRRLTLPRGIDFSSNGYLSLGTHPSVKASYLTRIQNHVLGSGGSRLLDGNSELAEQLEDTVAAFHGAEAALLFNSGFEANTGLFACVPQPGDVVVYDELIHASVHDGMRLSRAKTVSFKHNSVSSLREVLRGITNDKVNVFVAVEGVYSMDGDVAPLREIVQCVKQETKRGFVIVDEAHSTGVFGDRGRGLVSQLGLEKDIWARVHTFGKAMGCSGAMVLCSPTTREYMINYARSLIYTTAMGPPSLIAIQVGYEHLMSGNADAQRTHLFQLMEYAQLSCRKVADKYPTMLQIGASSSPIIPLFTPNAKALAQHCQQKGFMLRAVVAPTVPKGTDRVRLCLHADNTTEEIDQLCAVIESWCKLHSKL
ncbi:hypothetical protein Golomagni_05985 [Golovinomyces magnicellulatus]|nr:hypothetical protein Golomagni_05985 [Golovinomyces magnicellulatus]